MTQQSTTSFVSEWDLLKEINRMETIMQLTGEMHHVKSHQDKTTSIHKLPLPVQLNIEADKLAEARRKKLISFGRGSLYPSTKIQLVIDEDTVTKNVEHTIIRQYQEREMYPYYLMRYGWTLRVFLDIKWDAASMVNKKLNYDSFYLKLSQGILPTRFFIHKYNKHESPLCPACKCEIETNEHLFHCIHYSSWRQKFYTIIRDHCHQSRTSDYFTNTLLTYIKSYCHGTEYVRKPIHQGIFTFQTIIGWKNFFRGQITSRFQAEYEKNAASPIQHWTFHLLRKMWQACKELWEVRNEYEHGHDAISQIHSRRQRLFAELQKIYAEKSALHVTDQDKLYASPEEHLQHHKSTSQVHTWINMMKTTIRTSKQRVREELQQRTPTLLKYFVVQNSSRRKKKRNRRQSKVLKKKKTTRQHQTYLRSNYNHQTLQLQPTTIVLQTTLSPKLLQPEIPWATK